MKKLLETNKPNTFIQVELCYCKGGTSEYEREKNPRSYRLYIDVISKKQVCNATMIEYCPSDGIRLILTEPTRASKKAEAEAEVIAEKDWRKYAEIAAKEAGLQIIE